MFIFCFEMDFQTKGEKAKMLGIQVLGFTNEGCGIPKHNAIEPLVTTRGKMATECVQKDTSCQVTKSPRERF